MKTFIMFLIVVALYPITFLCQETTDVDLTLLISDNAGNSKELRYGLDPLATDGIDEILGELTLPPMPFTGIFETRFNLIPGTESTWNDYRQGEINYAGEKIHYFQYQEGSGATNIFIEWDMPNGVTGLLQDRITGTLINEVMSGMGSYTVPYIGIRELKMTLTYDGSLPVELTFFKAALCEKFVKMEWATATEVSNYGFEIEKRVDSREWDSIGFVSGSGNSSRVKRYSFEDFDLTGGTLFQYRLKQIDNNGSYEYSHLVEVLIVPAAFELMQNYPNPFNPSTKIKYTIPQSSNVVIKVFDILGNEIETLINEEKSTGSYESEFSASNLPSGFYFYRLQAGNFVETKKMILMK